MRKLGTRRFLFAWLAATIFSGLPSTLYAVVTGGDAGEATRAAGAMLVDAGTSFPGLFAAAALVHSAVSLFWAAILVAVLPQRHFLVWALMASAAIAFLDMRVVAPRWFPEVAALAFWPQFADHLMWGACLAFGLGFRRHRRSA